MNETQRNKLSLLFAFLGYAIFGFSFIFSKKALAVATPFVLLAIRFTVAFIILNMVMLTGKFRVRIKGKQLWLLLVLGLIQPVLYFIFENFGIKLVATSFAGILLSLVPIASVLFGVLLLKEKASPFQLACSALSVLGVFLTALGQSFGRFSLPGFLLLLGAVCATSLFNVLSRSISKASCAFERTYFMLGMGCVVFSVLALIQGGGHMRALLIVPLTDASFWVSVVFLSGLSSVGAFLMVNYAMTNLSVAKVSIFANITTIISILAGVLVLHESFGICQIIGSLIILLGVYGVNRPVKAKEPAFE